MKEILIYLMPLLFAMPLCAMAIDPADVKGSLKVNKEAIKINSGNAHLHDNAEGVLDTPKELRILLSDREVAESTLNGLVFLEAEQMAKQGKLKGILIKIDPNNLGNAIVTLLWQPPDPNMMLVNQTLSSSKKDIIKNFKFSNTRVSGEIAHHDSGDSFFESTPKMDYSIKFSIPVFNEPAITEDLKGKAAKNSPLSALYAKIAEATAKGDMKAVAGYSSTASRKEMEPFISNPDPEMIKMIKQSGEEMKRSAKKINRIVIRGDRAVMLFDGSKSWSNFIKEAGEWRSAN